MNGTKHVAIISDAASTGELDYWEAFSIRLVWINRRAISLTILSRAVQSLIKLTQCWREYCFHFCNFLVGCSVYTVCPSVLSCSNLKLHQTLEVKNIFKQENIMVQLTFNPGLTLTGFRRTRPWGFVLFILFRNLALNVAIGVLVILLVKL